MEPFKAGEPVYSTMIPGLLEVVEDCGDGWVRVQEKDGDTHLCKAYLLRRPILPLKQRGAAPAFRYNDSVMEGHCVPYVNGIPVNIFLQNTDRGAFELGISELLSTLMNTDK